MKSLRQLVPDVGTWSQANFGNQETPYLEVMYPGNIRGDAARAKDDKPAGDIMIPRGVFVVCLAELAPLMGIAEEVGELFDEGTAADARDACGDIGVYLCDYLYRLAYNPPTFDPVREGITMLDPAAGIVATMGAMFHAHLKRHQRIRGLHDGALFRAELDHCVPRFIYYVSAWCKEHTGDDFVTVLNETWNGIVKKRDWKADAANGGHHQHVS